MVDSNAIVAPVRPPLNGGYWEKCHGKANLTRSTRCRRGPRKTHTWDFANARARDAKVGGDPGMERSLGDAVCR